MADFNNSDNSDNSDNDHDKNICLLETACDCLVPNESPEPPDRPTAAGFNFYSGINP